LRQRLDEARGGTEQLATAADEATRAFRAALYSDLNAPQGLSALFTFVRAANRELDRNGSDAAALDRARSAFRLMDSVLDIIPDPEAASSELAAWVEERLSARRAARARRDFAEADRIRSELADRGIAVEDVGGTTKWKVVRPVEAS
jgi:cysteinyl-tRNA synthetase